MGCKFGEYLDGKITHDQLLLFDFDHDWIEAIKLEIVTETLYQTARSEFTRWLGDNVSMTIHEKIAAVKSGIWTPQQIYKRL